VKWTCPDCGNGFSRRWNLIRHIREIHHKREITAESLDFPDSNTFNMTDSKLMGLLKKSLNFDPEKNLYSFQDINQYNDQNQIHQQHNLNNVHRTGNSKENKFTMNEKNLEIVINQIYPKFEKLERLIIAGSPNPIKNHLIGKILVDAFMSTDPSGLLDKEIKNLQTKYRLNRILEYASVFYNRNKKDVWFLLITHVRSGVFKKAYE